MRIGPAARVLFGLALAALAGCAADTMAEVKGTVTVDGKPLAHGALVFTPVKDLPVTGCEVKDGAYTVRVHLGEMKVSVNAPKVVGSRKAYPNDPKSDVIVETVEGLPPRYNTATELVLDVKPGVNEKDFDLKSK